MEIKPTIEININELVLHGFSPADKFRIGQAVEQHVSLLSNKEGVPSSLQNNDEVHLMNAGDFRMAPNDSAGSIGNQIAGTIYTGFEPE